MRLLLGLALCGVLACATPQAGAPVRAVADGPRRLALVATTDLHGWLMPHELQRKDRRKVLVGGSAALAGYLATLRAEYPDGVVLLDGGDLFQGTLASNLTEGAAVIELYGELGYDATALGNHEFDFGPVGTAIFAERPGEDPLGALKARAAEARFPLLGANVREKATGLRPAWLSASRLVERGGAKVGIVGVATPDTPEVTLGRNVESLAFGDPAAAAGEEAAKLRAAGATVVILLAHIGGVCHGATDCDGPLLELLRRLPPGAIDVAFGGHTHRVVRAELGGVPVIQPAPFGKAFGLVELELDDAGRPVAARTRSDAAIQVCREHVEGTERCDPETVPDGPLAPARFRGRPVVVDAAIAKKIEPHLERVAARKGRALGAVLTQPLGRDEDEESALGDLVADAIRAQVPEADLAVTNSGGLRHDLAAGALTYGQIFEAIPFDNGLALLTLTGAELRELLRIGFSGIHGGLQVSGVTVTLELDRPGACAQTDLDGDGRVTPLDRDRVGAVTVQGRPLEDGATYRVATNDFLASGGSGWDRLLARLPPGRVVHLQDRLVLRDAVAAYLEGRGTLEAPGVGTRVLRRGEFPRCEADR